MNRFEGATRRVARQWAHKIKVWWFEPEAGRWRARGYDVTVLEALDK